MTTYYIDPLNGDDAAAGTSEVTALATTEPIEDQGRLEASAGDTIKLRDTATLTPSEKIDFSTIEGTEANPITFENYAGESPVVDFGDREGNGVDMFGSAWWVIRGIEFKNIGDNMIRCSTSGNLVSHDNLYEDLTVHHYGGAGSSTAGNGIIFYGDTYNNRCRNVVCHTGRTASHSDGFYVGGNATQGRARNIVFENCAAYNNADDGFDFWAADPTDPCTLVNCVAYDNGTETGTGATGDGNGFKMGGGGASRNGGGHLVYRCAAWSNGRRGFDNNGASYPIKYYNCTAWNNDLYGFHVYGDVTFAGKVAYLRNCVSYQNADSLLHHDAVNNAWNLGISNPQFASLTDTDPDFLRPTPSVSPLINSGAILSIGIEEYDGSDPDLGAWEVAGDIGPGFPRVLDGGPAPGGDGSNPAEGDKTPPPPPPNVTAPTTKPAIGKLKAYNGSSFVTPNAPEFFTGAKWQTSRLKNYDGAAFNNALVLNRTVEDFEAQSLANYSGETASFSFDTGITHEGAASLKSEASALVFRSDADGDVTLGREYRLWVRCFAGNVTKPMLMVQPTSTGIADVSGYQLEFDQGFSKSLNIKRLDAGASTTLVEGADIGAIADTWVELVMQVKADGTLNLTASHEDGTEIDSVTANDTTYQSGKVGFAGSGAGCWFDDLRET
ncbi:right-handed parallel beta-helix repeat-containing protein [Salinigranum halophilum]|uniref:right-handed parallel beta-helix repeat-containing protein n=1 Tax=Salinigranum halophilum TaxID=2565931 RepID=UPI0013760D6C|nr:right-handed parallel beta-helix repeat-containing protein [Salinigranum halophilum]